MKTENGIKIELRALDSLAKYARNSRTHSPAQVAEIMGSMVEFGWTSPIIADDKGIVAGHGRAEAAAKLYEQGKQIKLPGGDLLPLGMVPVIDCTGWSEAQRKAYVIADNRIPLNAGWDFDMLAVEIGDLQDEDFDISLLGFSQQELNDLIGASDDTQDQAGTSATTGIEYQEKFAVLVDCENEEDQREKYDQLVAMGFNCKVLVN